MGGCLTVCLGILTGLIAAQPSVAQEPSALQAAGAIENVFVDVIARTERSVVAIALFRKGRQADHAARLAGPSFDFQRDGSPAPLDAIPDAYATGVVLDRQGHILTNWHVLNGKHETMRIYARFAGKPIWLALRVKGADSYSDLAVLEIIDATPLGPKGLQPIPMGNAQDLKKGRIVIALGNPYAIARDGQVSASWGIVANLNRRLPPYENRPSHEKRPTRHHYGTLIQTDAKLNMGTSGGPLLNLKGQMVGLTTSVAALAGYEKSAGYAIAVDDTFRRVVETLKQGAEVEYGFLGVGPRNLSRVERQQGRYGVRIERVVKGTPAYGVLKHGDVVTHIEGEPILTTSQLMRSIGRREAGSQVTMTVQRLGRPTHLHVTLTKNRVAGNRVVTAPKPAWRGLLVEYPAAMRPLTQAAPIPAECVMVRRVESDSPATQAGLVPRMQISHVNGVSVTTPQGFLAAVEGAEGPVRLRTRNADGGISERVITPSALDRN